MDMPLVAIGAHRRLALIVAAVDAGRVAGLHSGGREIPAAMTARGHDARSLASSSRNHQWRCVASQFSDHDVSRWNDVHADAPDDVVQQHGAGERLPWV